MSETSYEGYVICPAPQLLKEGRWNHTVHVRRYRRDDFSEKMFLSPASFATRDEAIAECIEWGKQIIDGTVSGCSVKDL